MNQSWNVVMLHNNPVMESCYTMNQSWNHVTQCSDVTQQSSHGIMLHNNLVMESCYATI